jgi:hypothetical protein
MRPTAASLEPLRLHGAELLAAVRADAAELLLPLPHHRVAAAERCLSILARFLPYRAGIVRHRTLVVAARGAAEVLVMERHVGDTTMLTGEVLAARIGHRATIEIAGPADGVPFEPSDRVAVQMLADRYAGVLDGLGLVTDPTEIAHYVLDQ